MSGVTSLALGLVKIDRSEYMCFTIDNKKNGNTQKEEMKANETRTYPEHLRHKKTQKRVFWINIGKIKNYNMKLHRLARTTCSPERMMNSLCFVWLGEQGT